MNMIKKYIMRGLLCIALGLNFLLSSVAHAQTVEITLLQECLLSRLSNAEPDMTVGELRSQCEQKLSKTFNGQSESMQDVPRDEITPVQARMYDDQLNYGRDYVISPFKPNYVLLTYWDNPNEEPFKDLGEGQDLLKRQEVKFQVSMKAPLWRNMFETNNDLMFAFTSTSWWQYTNDDDDNSSAFRETNYEPEVFLRHYGGPQLPFGGWVSAVDIGLNHESNGRSELLSRSWNRVMGRAYLDYGDLALALRAWYRIPEDDEDDDNPRMYRYYGYGDVTVAWAPNKNTFTAMLRPGTEENGLELTWSYPISRYIRLYAQYWNGYGESLLDYDTRSERIGIGFALNDVLQR
ncbi:MAG: phospholipase A [Gammaproteobacteria bacterium]